MTMKHCWGELALTARLIWGERIPKVSHGSTSGVTPSAAFGSAAAPDCG